MTQEAVSIIGATGDLGFGLALRLGRAGVPVVLGSRDAGRAREAAEAARAAVPDATFASEENEGAVAAAEMTLLAVPFRNQSDTLSSVSDALRPGQVLIDASVPLAAATGGKPTRMLGVWQGSAAEQAQELAPEGVAVVSALHTVSAAALRALDTPLDEDVLVCGRRRDDKRAVAAVLDRIEGVRCVDAGPLEMARIVESITALMISVNGRYRTHAGIKVTNLPDGDLFPPLRRAA